MSNLLSSNQRVHAIGQHRLGRSIGIALQSVRSICSRNTSNGAPGSGVGCAAVAPVFHPNFTPFSGVFQCEISPQRPRCEAVL